VQAVQPRGYRTEFHVESGKMTLESVLPEAGRSRVQIPIQYEGSATSATFNSQYIKEAMAQAEGEEVTFHFNKPEDRLQPVIIELGSDFYYLVMPMR
jgi:DNA polymerase III sliding clamp (beta) subunit (PCNA family)